MTLVVLTITGLRRHGSRRYAVGVRSGHPVQIWTPPRARIVVHPGESDNLDLVAPLVKMPRQLQPARSAEAHNSVILRFKNLVRMGPDACRALDSFGGELPD